MKSISNKLASLLLMAGAWVGSAAHAVQDLPGGPAVNQLNLAPPVTSGPASSGAGKRRPTVTIGSWSVAENPSGLQRVDNTAPAVAGEARSAVIAALDLTTPESAKQTLARLSDLGGGTTGEVLHVDSGYHVVGMKAVDAPDISVAKE